VRYTRRMRTSIIVLAATTATAAAGPPAISTFQPSTVIAARDGFWVVGVDQCDEAGMSPRSVWFGAKPKLSNQAPPVPDVRARVATAPARDRDRIRAVAAYGDRRFAVGDGGTILASRDAGKTWAVQRSPTTRDLRAVWMRSATEAIAVGDRGAIVTTRDGTTWRAAASRFSRGLTSVWGAGDDVYAAGTLPLVSHDRGASWSRFVVIAGVDVPVSHVIGLSATSVFAFGSFLSFHSSDRGKTWGRVFMPSRRCGGSGPSFGSPLDQPIW